MSSAWCPLVVELVDKGIEAGLLLEDIRGRRARGLRFEREMETLVPAILLGIAQREAFEADAEPQLPHGQFAQPIQRVRGGEGHAVIGADRVGQAML